MRKLSYVFVFLLFPLFVSAQVITWEPLFPTEKDSITIYFNAAEGSKGLKGYTGDVYAHTGVITSKSTSTTDWKAVKTDWGVNSADTKLTRVSTDLYKLVIRPSVRGYYSKLLATEIVKQLAFVFRSSAAPYKEGKTETGTDIFLPVYEAGMNLSIISPNTFPLFVKLNDVINVKAAATDAAKISLYIDGQYKTQTTNDTLIYDITVTEAGKKRVKIVAESPSGVTKADSFYYVMTPENTVKVLPEGITDGINYNGNSVTFSLLAPGKSNVYLIGDFNNWEADPAYLMNITPDHSRFWLTINNLTLKKEYAFQYLVDGSLRICDPYAEKFLDPWNDSYISDTVYPGLMKYPTGKTQNIVSVFQPGEDAYSWKITDFKRPSKTNLFIYELLIRDFVSTHRYKTIADTLGYLKRMGVNAIELMPVSEFEGNESWGYNPMNYFAPDKYYGTKNDLKALIDEAHRQGIAVIMDVVLNHAYGLNPLVRLYWDAANNRPSADNPWFNVTSPNTAYSWGSDFNHESQATKDFVDRVTSFWIKEYKVDGYRFDFTKGFTNTPGDGSAYDSKRIAILKRMYNKIAAVDPGAFVILEHFAANAEEVELSNAGMMIWGNMNYAFNEATMGWVSTSDFSGASYKSRSYSVPNLVAYMESHDEERLMYKNLQYGNASGSYNIKSLNTALDRIKLAAAFFLSIPGPKMIWQFGELGYDIPKEYNGNTGNKPIRWDYYDVKERRELYNTFRAMGQLRTNNAAFATTNYSLSASGAVKKLLLNDASMNVLVIGNFGVSTLSSAAGFQNTGMWYDYLSGDSTNITDTQVSLTLAPGEFHVFTSKRVNIGDGNMNDVEDTEDNYDVIKSFSLAQNYPNPFNPATRISFNLPASSMVTLRVYDILGREIKTLVSSEFSGGHHDVVWNGDDNSGNSVTSGVYIYKIDAGDFSGAKKMLLLR